MKNLNYLVALVVTEILILLLLFLLSKQKKSQIRLAFTLFLGCLAFWTVCLIAQIAYQSYPIDPFFFEKFSGIGAFFAPVSFFFLGKIFNQTKITWKKSYWLLFIIPITSLILAFTNDYHHLFVIHYSVDVEELQYGIYFNLHAAYTFILYAIGLWYFISYSIKNSGFFSKQSILIIIGTIVPLVINISGLFGVPMPVYMPPISFTITVLLYFLAIFKFKFLSVTPIALQKIVDKISDSYIVLNDENIIIDFNQTFLNTFHFPNTKIRNLNIFDLLEKHKEFDINIPTLKDALSNVKHSSKTLYFQKYFSTIDKYFNIEMNGITSKNTFLGTLILFKDVTQHTRDLETIKSNQDMLIEKERFASLGQMIGGIAHNLKTPIMSIAGAAEGLNDLIKEYEISIDDPEVTIQDHHDIAKDMKNWVDKIKEYTAYMSDVITAVKGQAVTSSEDIKEDFTISELVKHVDILMKHELKNALINLDVILDVDPNLTLRGNINSLVQVINNMISNSIQSYNGKPNNSIKLIISSDKNNIIFSIVDYGMGMTQEVKDKLFKEMITTKGKNGTGLGLFMSYSNIKAHFKGNITFESEEGKGTTFYITIPIEQKRTLIALFLLHIKEWKNPLFN